MFKSSGLLARFLLCILVSTGVASAQTTVVTSIVNQVGQQTVPLGSANGVAKLDSTGNVPLSELGNISSASNAAIVTSVFFTPPSWATAFPTLQNAGTNPGTWTACTGLPLTCGGGGEGTGSYTLSNSSPSLSGASLSVTAVNATYPAWSSSTAYTAGQTSSFNGTNYYALVSNTNAEPDTNPSDWHTSGGFNALTYRHLGCTTLPGGVCTGVTKMTYDIWFYIPSSDSNIQAIEFDPDVWISGYQYFISMQCDSASGYWRFWNMAGGDWQVTNTAGAVIPVYPCKVLSQTNTWHHLQLTGTVSTANHTYAYQTFAIDGVPYFTNLNNSYSASTYGGSDGLNVEFQLDNAGAATTNTMYYDQMTLSVN